MTAPDVNENDIKAIGLDSWQNNNFARASRFFNLYIFLSSLHDYDLKMPNHVLPRTWTQGIDFLLLVLNFDKVRGTQREDSSKPRKHSVVERILVLKR